MKIVAQVVGVNLWGSRRSVRLEWEDEEPHKTEAFNVKIRHNAEVTDTYKEFDLGDDVVIELRSTKKSGFPQAVSGTKQTS